MAADLPLLPAEFKAFVKDRCREVREELRKKLVVQYCVLLPASLNCSWMFLLLEVFLDTSRPSGLVTHCLRVLQGAPAVARTGLRSQTQSTVDDSSVEIG